MGVTYGIQFARDKQHAFYCFSMSYVGILIEPQLIIKKFYSVR
jgi:hypothetical protein